jgi:hypothetical protein
MNYFRIFKGFLNSKRNTNLARIANKLTKILHIFFLRFWHIETSQKGQEGYQEHIENFGEFLKDF